MQSETMLSNTELQSDFIPLNLPVKEEMSISLTTAEEITPTKKRRAPRTLSARLSRMLKKDTTESQESVVGQGYRIMEDGENLMMHYSDAGNEYQIILPGSLRSQLLIDATLPANLIEHIESIRKSLAKKEEYKIHLDKERPSHVYFAYAVNGGPKNYYYAHPEHINVGPEAFESADDHSSFHSAVVQQNFNNVAYKKWREQYKKKFEANIITQELMRRYGTSDERAGHEAMQTAILHLHAGKKMDVAPVEVEQIQESYSESQLEVAPIAESRTTLEELLNDTTEATPQEVSDVAEQLDAIAAQAVEEMARTEEDNVEVSMPMFTPLSEVSFQAPVSQMMPTPVVVPVAPILPRYQPLPLVTLPQLQTERRSLARLEQDMEYYNGPFGDLVQLVHGVEYDNLLREYNETKSRFAALNHAWTLHTLSAYLADELSYTAPRYSLSSHRVGHAYGDASLADLQDWLARGEHAGLASVSFHLLTNAPVKGVIATGLLGIAPHVYAARPSVYARLASFFGSSPDVYDQLQQSLGTLSVLSTMDSLEGALDDEQMLQNALIYFELHALLSGAQLQSADRYAATYDPRYTILLKSYEQRIARQYGQEDQWLPEMADLAVEEPMEIADGVDSSLNLAVEQAAMEYTPSTVNESVSTQGEVDALADICNQLDDYLSLCEGSQLPDDITQLSIVENIAHLGDLPVSARAQALLNQWRDADALHGQGIMSVQLGDNESLFAALQRIIRTHENYFTQTPGDTAWDKAYALIDEVYQNKNLGNPPKSHEELIALGEPGEMVCYTANGNLCYLQS